MSGYGLLIPELLLLVVAGWALFAERLPGGDRGSAWVGFGLALAAAVAAALAVPGTLAVGGTAELLEFDGSARFARVAVAGLLALWFLWTAGSAKGRVREAVAMAAFASTGALLMASAAELITLMLALELATLPAYVLIGYRRSSRLGLEGALKYFLLSMLTSLVMLYGMSFIYGLTGSTLYSALDLSAAGTAGVAAVLLTFVGIFAKMSAAPFHFWTPDAYEGAEPWVVAFVSTVPKVAGAAALVRLASVVGPGVSILGPVLLVAAVASMVLGNLAALNQTDVRRMMAYSGVAHTGYLLLAVSALTPVGYGAALFYAVAYAIPSLGIMLVVAQVGPAVTDFGGLAQRRMSTAWFVVLMLVSLIGIPPLAGFFGKLYLFSAALGAGAATWVVVAVAMSVVSAGYYLRVVRASFFGEASPGTEQAQDSWAGVLAVACCALLTLAVGVAAGPILAWIGSTLP